MQLSRSLIILEVPIRPKIPQCFIYFSIFSSSAFYLSRYFQTFEIEFLCFNEIKFVIFRALEVLAMTKHELIPICQKKAKKFAVERKRNEEKVIFE